MKYDRCSATKKDMDFLINDRKLLQINYLLSEFGKGARYYNLDIVTKGCSNYKDPHKLIDALEKEIVSEHPELKKIMLDPRKTKEFNESLNKELIIILEKFARALSRLFTLGELGELGSTMTGFIGDFLFLTDDSLGETDYCCEK